MLVQKSGTARRNTIALNQALLSKDLTCLNHGRPTSLASGPVDTDGVMDLAMISSAKGPMAKIFIFFS